MSVHLVQGSSLVTMPHLPHPQWPAEGSARPNCSRTMQILQFLINREHRLAGRGRRATSLQHIVGFVSGGVHKRIDENRELLELLMREAPAFMQRNSWVEGWLRGHDGFFVAIEQAVPVAKGQFLEAAKRPNSRFPRPWPGRRAHGPTR